MENRQHKSNVLLLMEGTLKKERLPSIKEAAEEILRKSRQLNATIEENALYRYLLAKKFAKEWISQ